jgi:subtilisin family serine protease
MTAGAALATSPTTAGAAPADSSSVTGSDPKGPVDDVLGPRDRELLAQARTEGKSRVTLIVATDDGETTAVADRLISMGAKISRSENSVGYIRASVPTQKVRRAALAQGVEAVDLNDSVPLPDPSPDPGHGPGDKGSTDTAGVTGPDSRTQADNPFMPTGETGAVSFVSRHPRWDGRGVTIGVLDSGVDLDHPSLQRTSTGERKIVEWVTATDPVVDGDATWRAMLTPVEGPTFTYQDTTWKAPQGTWRVNRFAEKITAGSEPEGDVNRDGDTTDVFGILYDPASHDILVDVDQDRDFTDEKVMRPYRERFDIGHFGTDDPSTEVRDQMPFVVEYREDVDVTELGLPGTVDFVNIGIVEDAHGTHVAGITAANNLFGSTADGAAPGAKIVSARACTWGGGCTSAALTDGMVDLIVNRGVDVVNLSIGGLPALNDGDNARAELYNRLIEEYGVQIFTSAGNSGPGLNTVGDPSVVSDVVTVASSISKESWLANYGSVTRVPNQLHNFSSRGPSEAGAVKPDIAAPGSAISTMPMWQPGSPVPEAGYSLPVGYAMLNGTSMASPQSTGAAALLLSAATADELAVTPAQLRRAILSSADPIKGVGMQAQGHGMFDVPGAWRLLSHGLKLSTYTVQAPVCTPLSGYLKTPGTGQGIYNRCTADKGGQTANRAKTYPVKITRTSGPTGSVLHRLVWTGDRNAFRSRSTVRLPLNKTVTVMVTSRAGVGVRSAMLAIDDPTSPQIDADSMNVVIVSQPMVAPDYSVKTSGKVDRNLFQPSFVTVPEGTMALQVNLSGLGKDSQTRFIAFNPYGVPAESTSAGRCYSNRTGSEPCDPISRSYPDPMPGVWEIIVESRRTSPLLVNPFTLSVAAQSVAVDPKTVQIASAVEGEPTPLRWSMKNVLGPVRVTAKGGHLGSAHAERPSISTGRTHTYEVTVPQGASRLDVSIGNTTDPSADLDLTVHKDGEVVGSSADGDSEESVVLQNPEAGTYTIEVDGYEVPAGSTEYDYRDVFFSPTLGTLSTGGTAVELGSGQSATVDGTFTVLRAPQSGRTVFGEMSVVTDQGATVGRGTVSVGSVNSVESVS